MRPILFHSFPRPLPYSPTLALQQQIHELQLQQRRASGSNQDIILLLEHRPVYTAGRRQTDQELGEEPIRLRHLGADFVATKRGGQTTYHGPGQIVGYPLFDLGRMQLSVREYIFKVQTMLKEHFLSYHGINTPDSDNTGVFLSPAVKLASIGIQVRHRLSSHGFAYNVTREPLAWFNEVVACGLTDVKAGCLEDALGTQVSVQRDLDALLRTLSRVFDRDVVRLDITRDGTLETAMRELDVAAEQSGPCLHTPILPKR